MIGVMHRQFAQVFMIEFPRATSAYPRKKLQCLFAIAFFALFLVAPGFGNDLMGFVL
jgi:hypothetical protein